MIDRVLSEFEKEIRVVRDERIRVERLKNEVKGQLIDRVHVNTGYDTKLF